MLFVLLLAIKCGNHANSIGIMIIITTPTIKYDVNAKNEEKKENREIISLVEYYCADKDQSRCLNEIYIEGDTIGLRARYSNRFPYNRAVTTINNSKNENLIVTHTLSLSCTHPFSQAYGWISHSLEFEQRNYVWGAAHLFTMSKFEHFLFEMLKTFTHARRTLKCQHQNVTKTVLLPKTRRAQQIQNENGAKPLEKKATKRRQQRQYLHNK